MKLFESKADRTHRKTVCETYSGMTIPQLEQQIEQLRGRHDTGDKVLAIKCLLLKLSAKREEIVDELKRIKGKV